MFTRRLVYYNLQAESPGSPFAGDGRHIVSAPLRPHSLLLLPARRSAQRSLCRQNVSCSPSVTCVSTAILKLSRLYGSPIVPVFF